VTRPACHFTGLPPSALRLPPSAFRLPSFAAFRLPRFTMALFLHLISVFRLRSSFFLYN
jgi:hypothetical protein